VIYHSALINAARRANIRSGYCLGTPRDEKIRIPIFSTSKRVRKEIGKALTDMTLDEIDARLLE
jgi:hypothetical protein